jgi:two-component system chemotaxis response regulator CheY
LVWAEESRVFFPMLDMERQALPKPHVVLADDDEDWRDLLAASLEGAGYEVEQAVDGRQLQSMLEAAEASGAKPDLVVSDQLMPHLTGLEVMAWAGRHAPGVPFIILSAFAAPHIREPALLMGAAAVLEKPVDVLALRTLIAEVLARSHKN